MPTIPVRLRYMKRLLMIVMIGAGTAPAHGQGQSVTIGASPPAISTAAFSTTTAAPLKKGETLAADFVLGHGCTSTWTIRTYTFRSGAHALRFPVIGLVNCSHPSTHSFGVFASTTTIKRALRKGEVKRSGGYLMEAKRPVAAGESVPTLLFMHRNIYAVISIERLHEKKGANGAVPAQPWLTIFDQRLTPDDQRLVLDTWRESNETVAGLLAVPGQLK